ncbi:MAG: peptide deformylase [Candidatus Muiribacteriota bacterium]
MYKVCYYGNPVLRKESKDVEVNEENLKLAYKMLEVMKKYKGIGLAAPQIGISKKIFVAQLAEEEDPLIIFNLKILEYSEEKNVMEEGCLSLPGIYEQVTRPEKVKVSFLDKEGKEHIKVVDKVLARVFQHEGDHLYGKLFIDYLSLIKKNLLKKKLNKIKKGIIPEEFLPEEDLK